LVLRVAGPASAGDGVGGAAQEPLGLTRPVRIGGRGQDITRRRDERTCAEAAGALDQPGDQVLGTPIGRRHRGPRLLPSFTCGKIASWISLEAPGSRSSRSA